MEREAMAVFLRDGAAQERTHLDTDEGLKG
jgi:hypothetical protein